ncbi:MAG: tetratricopeptide repeat protein [Gammaproteobacteria bacterium]|nr:tetratricopeptide repeat protein [Gammaproteobacteria bacterium]
MVEKNIRIKSLLFIATLMSLLASCSVSRAPEVWDPLVEDPQQASQGIDRSVSHLSPAIASLLLTADQAIEKQQWQQAIASLERALRINGKQAEVWTRLAVVYLGQYNPQQSIHMAKRSNSYARADKSLQAYNWLIMSRAYTLMQNQLMADEAVQKSQQLEQASH